MAKILVTGGAGFIGSHLVDRLIEESHEVIVLDNLSTGRKEFIRQHFNNPQFKFYKVDLVSDDIDKYFKGVDEVWHLAGNADVRSALTNTSKDVENNIIATYRVLEAMRKNDVRKIFFTSSSTVYGISEKIPTPENYSPLKPISIYGATKLSCEALISAYSHTFGINGIVFRLANIIGPRSTHGVIYDFIRKLERNPNELEILGDGKQKKSYMYIEDCIDAFLLVREKVNSDFEVFNVGSEDYITVREIAEIVCSALGISPTFRFTGGKHGWKGDVPIMLLDIKKLRKLGFTPKYNSKKAVEKTVEALVNKKWEKKNIP